MFYYIKDKFEKDKDGLIIKNIFNYTKSKNNTFLLKFCLDFIMYVFTDKRFIGDDYPKIFNHKIVIIKDHYNVLYRFKYLEKNIDMRIDGRIL